MRVYTYSEAWQNLSALLNTSQQEEVVIKRRDGSAFSVIPVTKNKKSPFDVAGIKTKVTTSDILDSIRESRQG